MDHRGRPGTGHGTVPLTRRVCVVGNGGNGKSTFSDRLGELTGLEVTHLDRLLWRPGWARVPVPEFLAAHDAVMARPEWIIDGLAVVDSIPRRMAIADTIFFLDHPLPLSLWWAMKRQVRYAFRPSPDLANPLLGVTFKMAATIWRVHNQLRPSLLDWSAQARLRGATVHHFRMPRDSREFLSQLEVRTRRKR